MISPLQPFKTRYVTPLSPQHLTLLTRCYQPIIGAASVSLYLTLHQLPLQAGQWANPLMHAQLMELLDLSAQQVTVAREQLEAVGLLRTYQRQTTKANPLMAYELHAPLTLEQFMAHPLYSATLYSRIGDQAYYQLVKSFEIETIDLNEYMEVSQGFNTIFGAPSEAAIQAVQAQLLTTTSEETITAEVTLSFDFSRYYDLLRQSKVPEQNFTHQLRQRVQALHQLYGYNEVELAQMTRLAVNETTGQIEETQLQAIAKRMKQKTQDDEPKVDAQTLTKRQQQLQAQVADLTPLQAQIISLAESLPAEAFLNQVKQSKQGLMSSQESYNLRQLLTKTTLPVAVVNLVVYYLLMIEKQETLFKATLERTVDEWQQQQIHDVTQVFPYIVAKQKQKQQKQAGSQSTYTKRKPTKTEPIPTWLQQPKIIDGGQGATESAPTATPVVDDATLQARLQQLMKAKES